MRPLRAALLAAAVVVSLAPAASSVTHDGSFERLEHTNDAGTRTGKVFVPSGLAPGAPLMVFLHGCGGDADKAASETRFNEVAAREGFVVLYPEQSSDANGSRCWNWFMPADQHRDAGEPSIIAGMTRTVIDRYGIDASRVFVSGISAGGAMTAVMAATYPDVYAAATIHAGCFYRGFPCLASASAVPAVLGGQWAYEEMGPRARVVPILVFQGDADLLVPPINAEQVVAQWLTTDDWVDDGADDGSVARTPAESSNGTVAVEGGRSYQIDRYRDSAGCLLVERWLIAGMGHQYAGGAPGGEADPLAPDSSTLSFRFSMAQARPDAARCAPGRPDTDS